MLSGFVYPLFDSLAAGQRAAVCLHASGRPVPSSLILDVQDKSSYYLAEASPYCSGGASVRFCVLLAAFGRPAAVLPAASLRSPRHGRFIAEAFSCTATIEMALRFSCQADLSAIRETLALNKDTAVTNAASFIQRREAAASLPVINVELDASVPAPTSLVAAQMSAVNSATSLDGFVSTAMAALAKLKVYWRRLASLRGMLQLHALRCLSAGGCPLIAFCLVHANAKQSWPSVATTRFVMLA